MDKAASFPIRPVRLLLGIALWISAMAALGWLQTVQPTAAAWGDSTRAIWRSHATSVRMASARRISGEAL